MAAEPASDEALMEAFLDSLWLEKGLSDNTLKAYRQDLLHFSAWAKAQGTGLAEVCRADLLSYLSARKAKGLKARSTARALSCLRAFYRYLLREHKLNTDPTLQIDSPKLGRRLPGTLTEQQVEKLLQAPNPSTPLGLRDRAMLELLYACGLRVSELTDLNLPAINLNQGVVQLVGKGAKERLVPMGEEAITWLRKYLAEARPVLLQQHPTQDIVFPSARGKPMTRQTFWYRLKHHAQAAGIDTPLSPHTLRHAFATHLLNHNADLRVVQLLLGHSNLSTTQIYTHVAQHRMQTLHRQHHPRG